MRPTCRQRNRCWKPFNDRVLRTVLLGMSIGCLTGCAGIRPQPSISCDHFPEDVTPLTDEGQFQAVSPIPCVCRKAAPYRQVGSTGRLSATVVPPLPPLGHVVPVEPDRIGKLERRVQHLQAMLDRQQQLIETANIERGRIEHAGEEHADVLQQDLANIQQQQTDLRRELNALSQQMDRLAAVQATDREEQSQLLDEIIHGLEQALAPDHEVAQ